MIYIDLIVFERLCSAFGVFRLMWLTVGSRVLSLLKCLRGMEMAYSYAPMGPIALPMKLAPDNEFSTDLLDRWIRYAVLVLHRGGIRTYESCHGGRGHAFPEPTVRFEGSMRDAFRAVALARTHGLPIYQLRQFWRVSATKTERPAWELTFFPRAGLIAVQGRAERAGMVT
jgi:hypothetical protein